MVIPEELIGAIDIGGTKIAVGLVDRDGHVIARRHLKTAEYGAGILAVTAIEAAMRECLNEVKVTLLGIGIGCTGPINPITGIIGKVANLPGWENYPIVSELACSFNTSVKMENDADSAAMAESLWGSGKGASRFLYVTLSTGIGTGFLIDGNVYRGVNGSHPEMGHHSIDPSGPECYCGARGCWESLASGLAIREWYLENDPSLRFSQENLSAEAIFRLSDSGDKLAKRAVDRLVSHVGLGLANLTTILVPGTIAIGGGLSQASNSFLQRAIEIVHSRCREVPVENLIIETARLRQDVGLSGAAAVWLHATSTDKQ